MSSHIHSAARKLEQSAPSSLIPVPPVTKPCCPKDELIDIIDNCRLTTVFQPIIDLVSGNVYAYEALCRITGQTGFKNIESLFQSARKYNLTPLLERCCRHRALEAAGKANFRHPIALNVCPSVLMQTDPGKTLPSLYEELLDLRDRIIIELTERFYIRDYDKLFETIDFYRRNGFKIALDDLGAGFTRLKLLSRIQPAIIKIDRFLISDIHKNTQKQMLLESIVSFCRKISALVVAEGIETEDELYTIMKMKIDLAQGFYLSPPLENFEWCDLVAKASLAKINREIRNPIECTTSSNDIGSLASMVPAVESSVRVADVISRFQGEEKYSALPVVENQRPVGILQKDKLFYKLGQPHGYALFCNKPIHKIIETALVFDFNTPLEEVARTILKRNEKSVYDAVIVVKNGAYAGIVEIYQLLHGITEQKIQMAMQANPLTGLPGNNMIQEQIVQRLNQNQLFAVLYFDLDNFKPFNDNFGFHQGDRVIRFLADLIKEAVQQWDETGGFVGHIGGDDFVAVCRAGQVDCICQTITRRFDIGIRRFHDNETLDRGYYISRDRKGKADHFPLLSVSIAVVTTEHRCFQSYGHLISVATDIKKRVKRLSGSDYYIDQRLE